MKKPFVSIVFPNHNGGKEPLECLDSISKLSYPKSRRETIVVDNNSTDGSVTAIKRNFPDTKLILLPDNKGFSHAINTGVRLARGDYIFIGNDDLVFEKSSLEILVRFMEMHPTTGITGGKIFYKNNPHQVASAGYTFNRFTGNIYAAPQPDREKEVDWIQGCALLVKKKVWDEVGPLDTGFGLGYFEDIDLCWRVKRAGYEVRYIPGALFWHGVTTSMNKNLPRKYYEWYKNKIRFVLLHLPPVQIMMIVSLQLFVIMPFRALILRDGRIIPFLKGLKWNITNLNNTFQRCNALQT